MVRYEWVIVLAMWCGVMPWMLDDRRRQAAIPGFDQYVLICGTVILCVTFAYLSALGVGIQGGLYVYREHLKCAIGIYMGLLARLCRCSGCMGSQSLRTFPFC